MCLSAYLDALDSQLDPLGGVVIGFQDFNEILVCVRRGLGMI